jgi:hypothetical protein
MIPRKERPVSHGNEEVKACLERLGKLHHPGLVFKVTNVITKEELTTWLEAHGWGITHHANPHLEVWTHPEKFYTDREGGPVEIVLPARADAQGAAIQYEIAVNMLGAVYERQPVGLVGEVIGLPPFYLIYGWRQDLLFLDSYMTGLFPELASEPEGGGLESSPEENPKT